MRAYAAGGSLLGSLILATAACAQTVNDRTSATTARSTPRPGTSAAALDLRRVEALILEATNQFRREQGRGHLRANPALAKAARAFAEYMARTGKFGHTADGKQPWERTAAAGYEDCIIAENIAWELDPAGFTTQSLATALVEGWKKSPHHRKNLLDPDVDELGVGVAFSKDTGRYYAVQDFGRPKSEEIVFTVANETDRTIKYTVDGQNFTVEPRYTVTHQRCRPPQFTVHLPEPGKTTQATRDDTIRVASGAHYFIIGPAEEGRYQVQEQ